MKILTSLLIAPSLALAAVFQSDSGCANIREQYVAKRDGAPTSLATNLDLRVQAHAGLLRV
jgi:hypothetical protein